jgi:hypothetical protein
LSALLLVVYRFPVNCDALNKYVIGMEIMGYDPGIGDCPLDFREEWREN